MTNRTNRRLLARFGVGLSSALLAAGTASAAMPGKSASADGAVRAQQQKLATPLHIDYATLRKIDPALFNESGEVEVLIRLKGDPAAMADMASPGSGPAAKSRIMAEQTSFISRGRNKARSMKVTGSTQVAINAVFAKVLSPELMRLAEDADVERISMVRHYELHLAETVPQIGAAALRKFWITGRGVKVAVLDSGVDYTHEAFGGPGTAAAYAAAYGPIDGSGAEVETRDGLFPTRKVVEGFDFVGEAWPFGERTEDDDPIAATDVGNFGGHGTHVADIIGGISKGAPGVAPGVKLYAVKTCAAFSPSCNGVALIKGVEYSIDPNGDGDTRDRVDIMNMSLGADFGQAFDDDLAYATNIATQAGILTVASAGNGGDIPFITGTPAAASTALSVAQTQVASAVNPTAMQVIEPAALAGNYEAVFQSWSAPLAAPQQGIVTYGDPGDGTNANGCLPFSEAVSGIVMVDRGGCNFTAKIANIQDAGGSLGIIGLVTPEAPFNGADGGDRPASGVFEIAGFQISQADADILRAGGAVVRFDPDVSFTDFTARMVNSSSRGPGYFGNDLKPEIGAPGASVSASSSTGTGNNAFGGTSGAAPMVAGSAALLMSVYPWRSPAEIKAVLMNTAWTDVVNSPAGDPAPISRVGGGEVRADAALFSPVAAWDKENLKGGLSFGLQEVDGIVTLEKKVKIRNYSFRRVRYKATPTFLNEDDEVSGAISVEINPRNVSIRPWRSRTVTVRMTIDGNLLPGNFMNDGSGGGNAANLTLNEYDGYVVFESKNRKRKFSWFDLEQDFTMPWHVLPRKAARVVPDSDELLIDQSGFGAVGLTNLGAGTAQNDVYSLLHLATEQPPRGPEGGNNPNPSLEALGVQTIGFPDGTCEAPDGATDYGTAFAFHYWARQPLALWPGLAGILLDTDGDGADDYDVFNMPLRLFNPDLFDGDQRNVTVVADLAAETSTAFFFTEHATNTANQVLLICNAQIGNPAPFTQIPSTAYVQDVFFGNSFNVTPTSWAPLGERYFPFAGVRDLLPGESSLVDVFDFGAAGNNPTEIGLMFFTNGDRGPGNRGGATEDTEALFIVAPSK